MRPAQWRTTRLLVDSPPPVRPIHQPQPGSSNRSVEAEGNTTRMQLNKRYHQPAVRQTATSSALRAEEAEPPLKTRRATKINNYKCTGNVTRLPAQAHLGTEWSFQSTSWLKEGSAVALRSFLRHPITPRRDMRLHSPFRAI